MRYRQMITAILVGIVLATALFLVWHGRESQAASPRYEYLATDILPCAAGAMGWNADGCTRALNALGQKGWHLVTGHGMNLILVRTP